MSQKKIFSKLIQSFTDVELDTVAHMYLKEVEGNFKTINCNGPYDSGLDFRNINIDDIDYQIQATTIEEKNFEKKLFGDLKKAQDNVNNHNLTNKVKYFYSYPITNHTILNYRKKAKNEFGLNLEIIEANTIAEVATIYDNVKDTIFEVSNLGELQKKESSFFKDTKVRAFYDLMSIGSANDIKYNITKSYIIVYLKNNGESNQFGLFEKINEEFSADMSNDYLEGILRRMNSEKKIKKTKEYYIDLTDAERERITSVLDEYSIEEVLIRKKINEELELFDLSSKTDDVIVQLSKLYESNYAVNLSEFTFRNSTIHDLETSTIKFINYLVENGLEKHEAEKLASSLFKIADDNVILSRIAAGQVFSKISDPDRLNDYVSQHHRNKNVFIDTNVLINLILAHYDDSARYEDYHYKVACQFLKFAKKNDLKLKTIRYYAIEVTNLFKHALDLIPFTRLPYFDSLGKTGNLLYNFYQNLNDWGKLEEHVKGFEEFLREFEFEYKGTQTTFTYKNQMEYLLASLGVEIEEMDWQYDISIPRKQIEEVILRDHKSKSPFAIKNDAIMFMRLGDPDVDINPIEPIFCTWDMILNEARKLYFKEYPNCTKWFTYTPTRLMDHFSMMGMKVQQGALSNELLTILDDNYNFQEQTQSLLDSLKIIINPNDETGLKYTKKLAELRNKEIIQIHHVDQDEPEMEKQINPVDIVFNSLLLNYSSNEVTASRLDSLKILFTKEDKYDEVILILKEQIEYYSRNRKISDSLYTKIDELM
ncbi:hypothetical protein ASG38_07470 [Flavobacterium sp. Leaf359]|uniref:hypothetical protein n=1 Tax=Flavobacterium sp. Leaf359 TaxID=1736351 RepID=UPI0006F38D60|nr:hypothetical protein [Flavobacterium sp. Leaf359]KQS47288.1 hypothetical protein ASG38_07470 [Flavobacterium sp. Leaf359]